MPSLQNSPAAATTERSNRVDSTVLAAFDQSRPGVTVVAVGGFGRRELFPYSDVDLLLLTTQPLAPEERDRVADFLRRLWDAGLRVSQSVHTVAECCALHENNIELTISLLDHRYLGGDPSPYEQMAVSFSKFLGAQRAAITAHLIQAARARHASSNNTIYHLEPNVKDHPGGLRDLHVIHWLGKLKSFETESLADARDFIFSVRTRLHQFFQRDNNLLSFEAQEALAADPADWMRQYYRTARCIYSAANRALERSEPAEQSLFSQFRDRRARLSTSEFTVARERVLLRNPSQFESDPGAAVRLLQFAARHGVRLAADTERRLGQIQPFHMSWPELRELLAQPHCILALRAMAELGLLAQFIPEWRRIDCLVVRDFYHRYTVDEHTLVAIQALQDLTATKDRSRERFAGVFSEIGHPAILRFALLLHDLGKGDGAGEHVSQSAHLASGVMERLQLPPADRDTVLFLIAHHLDLSSTMTSRDLSEPATARSVADSMGTIERLKLLTLLTYADVSAVNPNAMTPWRLEQLWRVYRIGHDELTRELSSDRIQQPEQADPGSAQFLDGFPTRYLRTHSATEIQRHRELAQRCPGIELRRHNGSYEITVVTPDRPALLASLSGALASFGFNILKAEAFANRNGLALDSFIFSDPHRTLELNPSEADHVRDTIERTILGKVDAGLLIGKRRRVVPARRIQPVVSCTNDVSATSTLIEIVAEDRPGLLYDLASAISSTDANIEVVLIDTEAHKALDVFYVTSAGAKLTGDHQRRLKAELVQACNA